ncbi:MAG: hypothetical protein IJ689_07140 [Alphaproteobacteria bacterium]|nr:hypothetical protein [Alphaproteobacteria bacterium]
MKKIAAAFLLSVLMAFPCLAQVQFGVPKKMYNTILKITPFVDYYPLGRVNLDGHYEGVFDTFLSEFETFAEFASEVFYEDDYVNSIRRGAKGKSDIILGMYSDTSLYEDLKFIYPAAIDNPVHLIMMPSRIGEIKKVSDLKNLKGAIDSRDRLSEFVERQIKDFNLEKIDNSYDLYGKLIRGEIDYIFASYWFGMSEMMKLGVRDMVSISKKSLWNMPVFIGISKVSDEREFLAHNLTQWLSRDEVREKIKNRAKEILKEIEEQTRGTVPPSYSLNN